MNSSGYDLDHKKCINCDYFIHDSLVPEYCQCVNLDYVNQEKIDTRLVNGLTRITYKKTHVISVREDDERCGPQAQGFKPRTLRSKIFRSFLYRAFISVCKMMWLPLLVVVLSVGVAAWF